VDWRGRRVPVVSFAHAVGDDAEDGAQLRARIAILNTLNGNPEVPYVGVVTRGVSRLVRITTENLEQDTASFASPLIQAAAMINQQPVWIPDLDALEQMVASTA
jgi:chemosensory pili system protein ChpC